MGGEGDDAYVPTLFFLCVSVSCGDVACRPELESGERPPHYFLLILISRPLFFFFFFLARSVDGARVCDSTA